MAAAEQLQDMMTQYCDRSSVYPDMNQLEAVLNQLTDEEKLHILKQRHPVLTPLRCAAGRDHTEIISTLLTSLQSSADRLKLLMVYTNTPLHAAARWGHTESVNEILEPDRLTAVHRILIMSVQCGGETAVQLAERRGHTATVIVLREHQHRACGSTDMIVQYCRIPSLYPGKNPLREYLAQIPDDQQRLEVLQREYGGRTPLYWATRKNHHNIIRIMLQSLAQVNRLILLRTRDWTPLHDAAQCNSAWAVEAIFDSLTPEQRKELVGIQDEDGDTAADVAKDEGSGDVLQILREYQI